MTLTKKFFIAAAATLAFAACTDGEVLENPDNPDTPENPDADVVVEIPVRPALGSQIDRTGRPAIGTALMQTFNGDSDAKNSAKDAYNAAGPSEWAAFADDFAGSLAILDSLDTVCGNQLLASTDEGAGRYMTLATILADDQLYVNADSGTCGTYLGLEAEVVGAIGAGDGGCGGRMPSDDIIDRSYSVLAAGILTGIDDTIAVDDCETSETFPFLCAPTI